MPRGPAPKGGSMVHLPHVERIDRRAEWKAYGTTSEISMCRGIVTDAVYRWRYREGRGEHCERQANIRIDGEPYCTLHGGLELIERGLRQWQKL